MKTVTINQKDFEQCLRSLKVIQAWASYSAGEILFPTEIVELCKKSLKPFADNATKAQNESEGGESQGNQRR